MKHLGNLGEKNRI